jgi:glycosyltransferase involved in cell wall biosynthesis
MTITVVISTYQRPDSCERALRSVLGQTEAPLEVLIVDDGSSDDTEARMGGWEEMDPRVRCLRSPHNSGTPATTRNIGLEHARGEWVAFLDDDDEWLPGKLAAQMAALAEGGVQVISANAVRSDDTLYFPAAPPALRPTQLEMMRANPIITSSVVVARGPLLSAGGFPTNPRLRGLEDLATWLDLAGRGLEFMVLGEPLIRYESTAGDRLSIDRTRIQIALTRLIWWHALHRPVQREGLRAAIVHSIGVPHVLADELRAAIRTRQREKGRSASGRGSDVQS